jgi:hypothetical protein
MWPENIISEEKIITPANLLEDYGRELGEKTKGAVKGIVRKVDWSANHLFMYKFLLYAEKIKYSFELINIVHDISLYPLYLSMDNDIYNELKMAPYPYTLGGSNVSGIKVDDEEFFNSILKSIFSSERTLKIVRSIYAQS